MPHGTANGEIEVWIYDKNGNEIGHHLETDLITFKNGNSTFNHRWNKFVWGGNRYAGEYCGSGDPLCEFGPIDHFFIDDVIVDSERIGIAYFNIAAGNPPPPPPPTLTDLSKENSLELTPSSTNLSASGTNGSGGGGCFIQSCVTIMAK